MKTPNLVTCPCQHCNGHIQFDRLQLLAGNSKIDCPHCGLETVLFVPPEKKPSKGSFWWKLRIIWKSLLLGVPAKLNLKSEAPKTAKLVRFEAEWERNLEEKLDNSAETMRVFGIISVVIGIFVGCGIGINSDSKNAAYIAWTIVIGSVAALLINYSISLLFNAAAEMIRLLKKQARVPFSGQFVYECGACKLQMENAREGCPDCGAKFEK